MAKSDLVRRVRDRYRGDVSYNEAEDMLHVVLEAIRDEMVARGEVFLPQIGKLQIQNSKPKEIEGVDGRVEIVEMRKKVYFKPSQKIKKYVNGGR
jgi:nucleoid DNA-binding protein